MAYGQLFVINAAIAFVSQKYCAIQSFAGQNTQHQPHQYWSDNKKADLKFSRFFCEYLITQSECATSRSHVYIIRKQA